MMLRNLQAEQAVLCALLNAGTDGTGNPGAWRLMDDLDLEPADFYGGEHSLHGRVYTAMLSLKAERVAVDLVTVGDRMDGEGKALAAKLARKQVTPSHARDYAHIIKDLSSRRLLRNVGANILEMAEDRETPMDTILGKAQQAVLRVNRDTTSLM